MAIDPSLFHLANIADTCAVWNVLSSMVLYKAARAAGVRFGCTQFVLYECLDKPRKNAVASDQELQQRLRAARSARNENDFTICTLDLVDLQAVDLLIRRKRLGMGELSSIAFARKSGQAFLTDDQKARKLATEILKEPGEQTTPHLFAWLLFTSRLGDSDKDAIVEEHVELGRPLKPFLEQAYDEACRCRLMANQGAKTL